MKFSLVAALVVLLAVAHGSEAMSLVKREVQSDEDRITGLVRKVSAAITGSTQDMVERVKEGSNIAQAHITKGKANIQPLVDNIRAKATKLGEQVKPLIVNIDDKIKPLTDNLSANAKIVTNNLSANAKIVTDNLQDQFKPLVDVMVKFFQQVLNQSKDLLPKQ